MLAKRLLSQAAGMPGLLRAARTPALVALRNCAATPAAAGGRSAIYSPSAAEQKAAALAAGRPDVKHFRDIERALAPVRAPAPVPVSPEWQMPHTIWAVEALEDVQITHERPERVADRAALAAVRTLRTGFDLLSGYTWGKWAGTLDEAKWLRRIIFLETVAGVPGMVGGMVRHLHSLRLMRKDHGWIHTLLSEAENERMHLMIALSLRKPGPLFRAMVVASQGLFYWSFGLAYLLSPRFCHRFVGYLEEEAVKTYTHLLEEIDAGRLPMFERLEAPQIAREYYRLPADAPLRAVFSCIRADESHHREVNHGFASLRETDPNPFPPGY